MGEQEDTEVWHGLALGGLMNEVDEGLDFGFGCFWEDAVTEVEDMTIAVGGGLKDGGSALLDDVSWGEQGSGVEIALDASVPANASPALIEGDTPVEAEDGSTGFGHGFEEG